MVWEWGLRKHLIVSVDIAIGIVGESEHAGTKTFLRTIPPTQRGSCTSRQNTIFVRLSEHGNEIRSFPFIPAWI